MGPRTRRAESPGGGRCSPRRGGSATYPFLFVSPGRAKLEALGRLVDQGGLRPVIGAVLPLAGIARAHALLEGGSGGAGRGRPRGKIAIAVHPLGESSRGATSLS